MPPTDDSTAFVNYLHPDPVSLHPDPVSPDGKRYFSPDYDGHIGGSWKELNSNGKRFRTLDNEGNVIGD